MSFKKQNHRFLENFRFYQADPVDSAKNSTQLNDYYDDSEAICKVPKDAATSLAQSSTDRFVASPPVSSSPGRVDAHRFDSSPRSLPGLIRSLSIEPALLLQTPLLTGLNFANATYSPQQGEWTVMDGPLTIHFKIEPETCVTNLTTLRQWHIVSARGEYQGYASSIPIRVIRVGTGDTLAFGGQWQGTVLLKQKGQKRLRWWSEPEMTRSTALALGLPSPNQPTEERRLSRRAQSAITAQLKNNGLTRKNKKGAKKDSTLVDRTSEASPPHPLSLHAEANEPQNEVIEVTAAEIKAAACLASAQKPIQEQFSIDPKKSHPIRIDMGFAQERAEIPGHAGRFLATFQLNSLVLTVEYEVQKGRWHFIEGSSHNSLRYLDTSTSKESKIGGIEVAEIGGKRYLASTGAASGMLFHYHGDGHLYLLTPEMERAVANSLGHKSATENHPDQKRFSIIPETQQKIIDEQIKQNRAKHPEFFPQAAVSQSAEEILAERTKKLLPRIGIDDSISTFHLDSRFVYDLNKEKGYAQTLQLTPTKGENGFYISINQYYRIRYKNPSNPTDIHVEYRLSLTGEWFSTAHSEIRDLGDGQFYLTLGYPLSRVTFIVEPNSEEEPNKPRTFREISDPDYRERIEEMLGIKAHCRIRLSRQTREKRREVTEAAIIVLNRDRYTWELKRDIQQLIQQHFHEPDILAPLLSRRVGYYDQDRVLLPQGRRVGGNLLEAIALIDMDFETGIGTPLNRLPLTDTERLQLRNEMIVHTALHYARSLYSAGKNWNHLDAMSDYYKQKHLKADVKIQWLNLFIHYRQDEKKVS